MGIAPDCSYHFILSSQKVKAPANVGNLVSQGYGFVEIRVYGFKREDFDKPPIVIVSYTKDGKSVGETRIIAEGIPEKLK